MSKPTSPPEYPVQEALSLAVDAATETLLGSTAGIGVKLVSTIASKVQQRKADRVYREILLSWAAAAQSTPLEFQSILWDRALDDKAFQDRLYETFHQMANARSDVAFPFIAMLTAPYALKGKEPDTFLKRTARLLERCEAEDIGLLQTALIATKSSLGSPKGQGWWVRWTSKAGRLDVMVGKPGQPPIAAAGPGLRSAGDGAIRDLLQLLTESRLGRECPDGSTGGRPGVEYQVDDGYITLLVALFAP